LTKQSQSKVREADKSQSEKVDLIVSADASRRIAGLRDLLPEAFVDNVFDPVRAASVLGLASSSGPEQYGLSWAGKTEALAALQVPSTATLRPSLSLSINYDEARNAVIEGDNLEVLRLLQRSYGGRVKMIYIDPPYNTGGDFIYEDDFRHGLDAYLRFSGQLDKNGNLKSSGNETAGRYHSKWLSMMYPRLALARNLLRSDGVIFVSIDDHEIHNLRLLMDEVFGPENFVASVIWQKVYSPKSSARHFSEDHDYVLVYARNAETWVPGLLPRTSAQDAAYTNPDDDPRGDWKPSDLSARNYYSKGTYSLIAPSGRKFQGPPPGRYWAMSKDKFDEMDADGRIWWGEHGDAMPAVKRFLSEVREGRVPQTLWSYKEAGHNQEAKKELLKKVTFASSDSVFDTPKPARLIRRMLTLGTSPDSGDIVLDFFAGSGTTGDAVLQANAEDGGNRRFLLVQAPERTGHEDFETVTDITRARLRAALAETDGDGAGLRDFSLATSNFKVWNSEAAPADEVSLAAQVELFADSLADDAEDEGIVVEILLKEGIPLDVPLRRSQVGGVEVIIAEADGIRTVICLGLGIGERLTALIDGVLELDPARVVFLERAFAGEDAVKSNAVFRLGNAGIIVKSA
jgi:adenine-specific DNA-methyltransferase